MHRLKQLWTILRSSFWFLPSMIVVFCCVLAVVLIETDSPWSDRLMAQWPRLFGTEPQGAREMMSVIASSMMTVVGVTFSMILVVLVLASSQYTSRILRNFMRSRVTQVVLGIFVGVFSYCLIVLRTIRGGDESIFVPNLSVFFGFLMALGGVGALIYFIHHIASSIQASSIIASVTQETLVAIDQQFPTKVIQKSSIEEDYKQIQHILSGRKWYIVPSREYGYIQSINNVALLCLAQKLKTIVRLERCIGDFIIKDSPLASVALIDSPDQELIAELQATFSISRFRLVEEDAAFGIRQIVDVALKALSPGINDLTTAVMCVEYLTVILVQIATRIIPSSGRSEDGKLWVIVKGPSFDSLLAESFDQIRSNASGNAVIMLQMLQALEAISRHTDSPQRRLSLSEQLQWIDELAGRTVDSPNEIACIEAKLLVVCKTLETKRHQS